MKKLKEPMKPQKKQIELCDHSLNGALTDSGKEKAEWNKAVKEYEMYIPFLLEEYTKFLLKYGYVDDDVWCEYPKAITRFLKGE